MEKKRKILMQKTSLKKRLVYAFLITSVIPIIIFGFMSYYNSAAIVKENMDELTITNLQQTSDSVEIWLDSYEDLLYQIYTDDDIIGQVDKINGGEDLAVTVNQLRRTLRGLLNSKDYVRSITIFTQNGSIVTYNQLTAVSTEDAWINNFSMSQEELYKAVSVDNKTHIFGTEYAATFAAEDYYLFHLAHRLINYKKVEERSAIVVVSLDEALLKQVCQSKDNLSESMNSTNFIVDDAGYVISYPDSRELGKRLNVEEKGNLPDIYQKLVDDSNIFKDQNNTIYSCHNDNLNWNIVNVSNHSKVMEKLKVQQNILTAITLVSLAIVIGIIVLLTEQLTGSIKKVTEAMEIAGKGDLSVRIVDDEKMPIEIEMIAIQFNETLEKLQTAGEKEKEAEKKQRNAEIKALEAQINPHFLYNTLDTINWMAIDEEEFEISNAISSLATILRYAIDDSNGIVKVREEVEWLKKYIFLQQTRLKNTFQCDIHIEQDIYEMEIHKLLLQPFIENAILHGFEGVKRNHLLLIKMGFVDECIKIVIRDNGKGIDSNIVAEMNAGVFMKSKDKNHIGLENAITRLHIYYGGRSKVQIKSIRNEGTEVLIHIPVVNSGSVELI